MLALLALVVGFDAPVAAKGPLEIVNVRRTYGYLGPERPAGGMLAGDVSHFRFDIRNLSLDKAGQASFSTETEIYDANGKLKFRVGPTNSVAQNFLGGSDLPVAAHMEVPHDTPAGDYSIKVKVHDRIAKKDAVFQSKGKVLPADFGLVRVGLFADRESKVPRAPIGVVGENYYVSFSPIGFGRDKKTGQPDLDISLRALDDKGQPVGTQPLSGRVHQNVDEDFKILPMQFGLTLNRPGRFQLELSATDRVTGKSAKVTLPIQVVAP